MPKLQIMNFSVISVTQNQREIEELPKVSHFVQVTVNKVLLTVSHIVNTFTLAIVKSSGGCKYE